MLRHPDGQPFTYQEFNEFLPAPQGELFGLPGFLPTETVMGLVNLSETIGVRKHIYTFPEPLPEDHDIPLPIAEAVSTVSRWVPVNTAILKRYATDEPSQAFYPHEDPEVFKQHWLVLISLSGEAVLSLHNSVHGIESVPCRTGDVICVAPQMVHSVTPPLNEDGVRHFLFLGYDSSLPRQ